MRLKLAALAALGPAITEETACAETPSPLRLERWSEDWSGVHDNALKNIALWHDAHLDLGLDARWKLEQLDAPKLGVGGEAQDGWWTQRLLAHADVHIDGVARLFVQIGAHDAAGRRITSSADDDRIDLNQAFIDLHSAFGATRATLRLGRQELFLGSPRFVTLRDNGNLRQRHELARLILTNGSWRADVFSGRPMRDRPGAFDDSGDRNQDFYGLRVGRQFGGVSLDFLYYDLARDNAAIAGVIANERRRSVGARLVGRVGAYDFDAELLSQTGAFGAQHVRALGASVDGGRRFAEAPWSPRAGARLSYGSGDSDPFDTRQETFAPPFPRGAWFGQNGLASFSNTVEAAATLGLTPNDKLNVDIKFAGLWRAQDNDYIYAGAGAVPGTRGGSAYIGFTPSLLLTWRASENVTVNGYFSAASVGEQLRQAGAHNSEYFMTSASLRY
ncbi:MAG: alginate export family protein [Terricaulis sp.]